MSSIKDLISRLNNEEKDQCEKDEKDFESQYKKQEEMHRRLSLLKEENKKHMDMIVKDLDQLTANQCAITYALEQHNLIGLPIPLKHHSNVINLISLIVSFMNKLDVVPKLNNLAVNEIFKRVVSNTASTKSILHEIQSNASQAQTLLYKTNLLKKLIKTSTKMKKLKTAASKKE